MMAILRKFLKDKSDSLVFWAGFIVIAPMRWGHGRHRGWGHYQLCFGMGLCFLQTPLFVEVFLPSLVLFVSSFF